MNFKKTIVSVLASTMVLNIGIGAYATSEVEKNEDIIKMAIETQVSQGENVKMTPLTEAQIAQIKLDAAKKIEKWEVLSAAKKQEGTMPLMHINSFNGKQSATTMAIPSTHEELNHLIHEEVKPSNHERIKPSNHERIKHSNHEGVNKNVKTH